MSTDNEDAVRAALDALLTRIDDAFDSYERFGGICKFEDEPMIHASMLTEIADLRGALHVATIAATPAHAAHAAQAELIATHEFDLDAYERLCQSKDATIKEQAERIAGLEAASQPVAVVEVDLFRLDRILWNADEARSDREIIEAARALLAASEAVSSPVGEVVGIRGRDGQAVIGLYDTNLKLGDLVYATPQGAENNEGVK